MSFIRNEYKQSTMLPERKSDAETQGIIKAILSVPPASAKAFLDETCKTDPGRENVKRALSVLIAQANDHQAINTYHRQSAIRACVEALMLCQVERQTQGSRFGKSSK